MHYAVSFLLKRGVTLKKIVPIFLTFFILVQSFFFCFYSTPVYGGLLDVDPDLLEDMANNPEKYEPATMKLTEFLLRTITGGQALDKFFGTSSQELISNIKALFLKEGNCKTDGNNYYLTQDFVNEFNKATQDKVHALDGYYLIEPLNSISDYDPSRDWASYTDDSEKQKYKDLVLKQRSIISFGYSCFTTHDFCLYLVPQSNGNIALSAYSFTDNSFTSQPFTYANFGGSGYSLYATSSPFQMSNISYIKQFPARSYGIPYKIFYSRTDLQKYLDNGKKRIYAPQLPSTTISIPIKYINSSVSLPDITYNINITNKTEVEIQNEYNTTLNNYLNDLNKFSDGGSGNNPTPTPSGGGSGDFGDGTTPTPKPDFGDGSDLTDTNDWLKKIYEWLQSFGDTHSKFE